MPTKRAASAASDPDEPANLRSVPDADDSNGDESAGLKGGWGASQQIIDSTSSWAQSFRPEEKSQVIAFLEPSPYVAFRRHWIESIDEEKGKTNRPYVCYQTVGKECPLCKAGDKPQAVSCFNVALVDENGDVALKSWDVGARLYSVLKAYSNDPKIGPLPKGFFLVSRTGTKSTTQYNVTPVKASALAEDYDVQVPSRETLDRLTRYTADIVKLTPLSKMKDLADELGDAYG